MALITLLSAASLGAAVAPAQAASVWDEVDAHFMELVNQEREDNGLEPLAYAPGLQDGAEDWSHIQAEAREIWHGDHIAEGARQGGCSGGSAENVYFSTVSPGQDPEAAAQRAFEGYMNSPGHRDNILSANMRFHASATVHRTDTNEIYHTHRFAGSCDESAEAPAPRGGGSGGSTESQPPQTQSAEPQPEQTAPSESTADAVPAEPPAAQGTPPAEQAPAPAETPESEASEEPSEEPSPSDTPEESSSPDDEETPADAQAAGGTPSAGQLDTQAVSPDAFDEDLARTGANQDWTRTGILLIGTGALAVIAAFLFRRLRELY